MSVSDLQRKRRNAKASLTRNGKTVNGLLELARPAAEVQAAMDKVRMSFDETVKCHDNLMLLKDDTEFTEDECWLEECRKQIFYMQISVNDYINSAHIESEKNRDCNSGLPKEPAQSGVDKSGTVISTDKCTFKLERPKLPRFNGNVREYITFRSDFKHTVECQFSHRDCIMLLRTCLEGKPREMVSGIGDDYLAAWEYLDAIYGDPRFIADTITHDIDTFEPLSADEDERFCDLVHLVRRSYNSLKEVNRKNDMDNNHMLALIEQKMSLDDRKVWSRELEHSNKAASLDILLNWMTREMKSRIRATAKIRNSITERDFSDSSRSHGNVNYVVTDNELSLNNVHRNRYRCWVCNKDGHCPDKCKMFLGKCPAERFRLAKETHVCFSCLKQDSSQHTADTCPTRRPCPHSYNGRPCKFQHHPLLHPSPPTRPVSSRGTSATSGNSHVLLPTVICNVIGQSSHKHANVLLDSGSQLSLITDALAEELNLRGTRTNVVMSKVGGEHTEMSTNVYEVPVQSLDDRNTYMIHAIGIPYINDDHTQFNRSHISNQFGISSSQIHRKSGPIELLVGTDHSFMHAGMSREMNGLVARLSPLGWVISGTTHDNSAGNRLSYNVCHVKICVHGHDMCTSSQDLRSQSNAGCACSDVSLLHETTEKVSPNTDDKESMCRPMEVCNNVLSYNEITVSPKNDSGKIQAIYPSSNLGNMENFNLGCTILALRLLIVISIFTGLLYKFTNVVICFRKNEYSSNDSLIKYSRPYRSDKAYGALTINYCIDNQSELVRKILLKINALNYRR